MGRIYNDTQNTEMAIEDRTKSFTFFLPKNMLYCENGSFQDLGIDKKDFLEFKRLINSVPDEFLEER